MPGYENTHPSLDDPNAWVPYRYHPSLPLAAAFATLFGLATLAHRVLLCVRRTRYLTPFIVGGCFEIIGYIGRAASSHNIWALGPFIIQSIFLLVAPALFAASIYIVLGRIILLVDGEEHSPVRQKWLTNIFVAGDAFSFLLQMAGGGIQAGGTLTFLNIGEKLIIVGLFAQIAFFGIFIIVAIVFHLRFSGHGASQTGSLWRRHIHALYWGSGLIMFRSIFRVVEYLMGNDGFLLKHEYFLYIFDAAPMFVEMLLFVWIHPSEITRAMQKGEPAQEHDMNVGSWKRVPGPESSELIVPWK